jgi:signal-transduction protein with cAMP-binding, CBS, and nucleotidyltransferase domain
MVKDELWNFPHLFFDTEFKTDDKEPKKRFSNNCIFQLLSFLELEQFSEDDFPRHSMVVNAGDEFTHFHMIKQGTVKVYDRNFNYLVDLDKGSFFGETGIVLGLFSSNYFMASSSKESRN